MSAVSGQYGRAKMGGTALVECTRWDMDESVVEHVYSSCATAGYRKRVAGPKDKTGTIEGIFDPDSPIHNQIEPGDEVTLELFYEAAKHHQVPAMILTLNTGAEIEGGDPLRWRATWGLNGTPLLNQT
jgi:hypothetical protein